MVMFTLYFRGAMRAEPGRLRAGESIGNRNATRPAPDWREIGA